MNIDFNNWFVQGVIASFVAAVISALFVGLFKMLKNSGRGIFDFLQRGKKEKTGLDTYLKTLADKTLCISHPWMKEDQQLTDILVPIYFEVNKMAQREELETYLAREYQKNPELRMVITGKPGSGKTIAMRVMARAIGSFETDAQPVPVLLAFTDIKGLTETHQKIAVLNRIAFHHIDAKGSDDELINEEVIHAVSREEMARLSLKKEEYPLLEKEIVQNSGLLQAISPSEYCFPHRTFMEFFAASYLDKDKEKSARDILVLYDSDPKKWKEVLLLYLGLNKNRDYADFILKRLAYDFTWVAGGTR